MNRKKTEEEERDRIDGILSWMVISSSDEDDSCHLEKKNHNKIFKLKKKKETSILSSYLRSKEYTPTTGSHTVTCLVIGLTYCTGGTIRGSAHRFSFTRIIVAVVHLFYFFLLIF